MNIMRTYIISLLMLACSFASAHAIEVYSGGKRFSDVGEYRSYQKKQIEVEFEQQKVVIEQPLQETKMPQETEIIREDGKIFDRATGTLYDPQKMKTVIIGDDIPEDALQEEHIKEDVDEPVLDEETKRKLKAISVDQSIQSALKDFEHVGDMESLPAKKEALGVLLEESSTHKDGPLLLISDQNRVKVLQLNASQDDQPASNLSESF